ncbi:hypothetical protein FHS27_005083, partial [Rhodopirellula rubra]|nr:hypothetical protein [Aporhodopirellula rubra]
MLVLSRGQNDRIVFPSLGISVEVLKINGSRASLGVVAPKGNRSQPGSMNQAAAGALGSDIFGRRDGAASPE